MIVLSNGSFSNELAAVDSATEEQQLNTKHTVNDKVRLYTGNFFDWTEGMP